MSKLNLKENSFYTSNETPDPKKVNLNDLVSRLKIEQKKEQKSNIILSAAAISAVAVFGIILTL
jgi:hypothetical protein|tara:strand:- start:111 stop:302 length:192 start_codon:yes stop_codon:yes gene_type:complete